MLWNTLLRNAAAVDGGGSAPKGTLSFDDDSGGGGDNNDTVTATGDNIDNNDGDNSEEIIESPEAGDSPIEKKIDIKGGKTKEGKKNLVPTSGKPKAEDLSGEVPDIDDLYEFSKKPTDKQEEKKEADKKDNEEEVKEEISGENNNNKTGEADNKEKPPGRDYSIFEPQVAEFLKKQPNVVYEAVKKSTLAVKELNDKYKELETKYTEASKGIVKLPDSYIEHPQAYVFDPQYAQHRANIGIAKKQEAHWMQQLENIAAGQPWYDIKGLDDKGEFVLEKIDEASVGDTENIRQLISEKRQEANASQQQIGALKNRHTQLHTTLKTNIETKLKEYCPWIQKPEIMEKTIPVFDLEKNTYVEKSLKQIGEDSIKMLGPALRNNIALPIIQNLQIGLAIANAKVLALSQKKEVTQQIEKDTQTAEPILNGKGGGAKVAKNDKIIPKLDDMDE